MTTKGSCVCGQWTYEYEGEPVAVTAGSNGSFNLLIPNDKFHKLSGEDFKFERTGDSGNAVKYRNCGNCATVMTANTDSTAGLTILKGGTVDDFEADKKHQPVMEIYTRNRPEWCHPFASAQQKEAS
ncbi:hypothetical protein PRZ48_002784 [Zasmidium cellare]|uniref:CENP-V/GFA domain-containing protein n=1 Tax=Zasmidium cellare TaxID=395010 RepID=A0ABR0ETE5_ZASCE|nr:hypothetical protein PRZ48_002784 [Zasmidium cellare]